MSLSQEGQEVVPGHEQDESADMLTTYQRPRKGKPPTPQQRMQEAQAKAMYERGEPK